MFGYLRRLATTGFAYTASNVLAKLVAIALLPLYTRYLTPADYGAAEVMIAAVTATSIVIRLGVIEALMRFYYLESERPERVVSTGFASLFWSTTAGAALALAFAAPISEALLEEVDVSLTRIAIGGLWVFTIYEYLVALFRLEERARAYFFYTAANVVLAVPLTVWLVVVEGRGADGLLAAIYLAAVPFLLLLAFRQRRRLSLWPDFLLLGRLMRFGLPAMPAELSLYSLNVIDRILLVRLAGLAEAGLYALAFKFSGALQLMVRGFKLAWPPLAYSIRDSADARHAYAVIVTWFAAISASAVAGMWLFAPWMVRLLAAPEFFESYEAVGLLSLGAALYGLYLVLVVVLGRTGRTEFNLPAALAATAANIGLNLALIPPLGIVGAGLALVASYLVVLVLMFVFTHRLFPVPWEWRRLAAVTLLAGLIVGTGELLVPSSGAAALLVRAALWLAYPALLFAVGLPNPSERAAIARLMRPGVWARRIRRFRAVAASGAADEPVPAAAPGAGGPRIPSEVYEAELRDEDRGGA
jgi:O-antigen/teichoic acid export membrane protein